MEQVKSFLEKVKQDKDLQAKMKALAEKKADSSEVASLAKDQGFSFTAADFDAFAQETAKRAIASGNAESALSEEQLAAVAGGLSTPAKNWLKTSLMSVGLGCAGILIASAVKEGSAGCTETIDFSVDW